MKAKAIPVKDEELNSTIMERATERRISVGEGGNLVFVESDHGTTTFDLDDLFRASAEGLGKGNFGNCYKAMMEVGPAVVVKRLRDLKPLNKDELTRQITAIADQKHSNLLPLLAYFYSQEEKLFVYKFAANGNLRKRNEGANPLPVARALNYLHGNTRSHTAVPHGNLKSTNVLIDEILVADYGLTSLIALRGECRRTRRPRGGPVRVAGPSGRGEVFDEEMAVQRGANRGMLKLMQIGLKCCDRTPEMGEVEEEIKAGG
ncbi:hypothetical protein SASPL_119571 [Salvia splendens]|uniref:Protein kinase domain-containing protein n=1 Tax=Salvia splendens TaxID=180675 RepID=A0A8X8XP96_SALSN|nr:hypothetical protein SASPL_119571 [Salvia splendens]